MFIVSFYKPFAYIETLLAILLSKSGPHLCDLLFIINIRNIKYGNRNNNGGKKLYIRQAQDNSNNKL